MFILRKSFFKRANVWTWAMFWSLVSLLVFGFTLGLTNFNPDIPMALKLIVLGLLSQLVKVNFQIYTRKTSPTMKSTQNDTCIN